MKLSAPIHRLRQEARRLARAEAIPLHAALDRIATAQGYARWSLLAARKPDGLPAATLLSRLAPGDLALIGARPGQGKTLLGLGLAVAAMEAGRKAAFFTLEETVGSVLGRFRTIGAEPARFRDALVVDDSDDICAAHIVAALAGAPRGSLAVIDYLQLLDRRREHPELAAQVRRLRGFARENGLILVFLSQIDRSYDPALKPCPDLGDVRLANPLDLSLFAKACFLQAGELRFEIIG